MKGRILAVLVVFAAFGFSGCRKDEIEVRRVAKEEAPAMPMAAAAAGGAPMSAQDLPPAAAATGLHWKAPAGWKELPGNGIRAATFEPPQSDGKIEGTVVALPGDSGGELANVNRWRGQLTLPAVGEDQLASLRQRVRSRAGEVLLYDFTSEDTVKTRMTAGMLKVGDTTWFFKLTGAQKAVAAAKPAFVAMLKGLTSDEN